MISKRQQIVNAIDARFKTITTANGYVTNIGNRVACWETVDLSRLETMMLLYRDRLADILDSPHDRSDHRLGFEANIVAKAGALTADEVRAMINDVSKSLGVDYTLGGLAISTRVISHEVDDIEQLGKIVGGGTVRFEVLYRTALFET